MKKNFVLLVGFILFGFFLAACGREEPTPPPAEIPQAKVFLTEVEVEEIALMEKQEVEGEIFFSTDWYVCATIAEGEWAVQALRRAGKGEPRERFSSLGQRIEILHAPRGDQGAWIEIFDWESFLKNNPQTFPGDRICDTFKARLRLELEPKFENVHIAFPEVVIPLKK